MPDNRRMGYISKIDPPLVIDGDEYSILARFLPSPEIIEPRPVIVSGEILSVTSPSAGRWRIVCKRAGVPFSYTAGPQNEVTYFCQMGGNIVAADELLRAYNWLADLSVRGSVAHVRCIPADMVWIQGEGFYVESCEAFSQAPAAVRYDSGNSSGPGRCPRITHGVVNFATLASSSSSDASTDVNENRANWYDVVNVYAPWAVRAPQANDSFEVRRDAVCNPFATTEIEWATRTEDTGETWATLGSGDRILRSAEGIVLIKKDWVDANVPEGAALCLRFAGQFFPHNGSLDARTINELAGAVDALENLYTEEPVGGFTQELAGYCSPLSLVDSAAACYLCQPRSTGLMWGNPKRSWLTDGVVPNPNVLAFAGASLPQWANIGFGPMVVDQTGDNAETFTSAALDPVTTCCPGTPGSGGTTVGAEGTSNVPLLLFPYGGSGLPDNVIGTDIAASTSGIAPIMDFTKFRTNGIGFGISPKIARLLATAEVLDAKLMVKPTGLRVRAWGFTWSGRVMRTAGLNPDVLGYSSLQISVNGELVIDQRDTNAAGGPLSYTRAGGIEGATATEGLMGYALVGGQVNTRNVRLGYNYAAQLYGWDLASYSPTAEDLAALEAAVDVPVQETLWEAMGGGISAGALVQDGKWGMADCTAAIKALFRAKESKASRFMLFPQVGGGPAMLRSVGSLKGYVAGLRPGLSVSTTAIGADIFAFTASGSGQWMAWEGMDFGKLLIKVRFANGTLDEIPIAPIARGRMTP